MKLNSWPFFRSQAQNGQGSHVSEAQLRWPPLLRGCEEVVHLASNATLAGETVGELLAATQVKGHGRRGKRQDAYSKGRENAVRKDRCKFDSLMVVYTVVYDSICNI